MVFGLTILPYGGSKDEAGLKFWQKEELTYSNEDAQEGTKGKVKGCDGRKGQDMCRDDNKIGFPEARCWEELKETEAEDVNGEPWYS